MSRKHRTQSMNHHQCISLHSNGDRECNRRSQIEKWEGNDTDFTRPVKGGHDA